MQIVGQSLITLVVAASLASAQNPVSKALNMLEDMASKLKAEGEEAAKLSAEAAVACKDTITDLGFEIKTGAASVDDLKAAIAEHQGDASNLVSEIEELAGNLAKDEASLKDATELRAKEEADFKSKESVMTEDIGTLERAIDILEREFAKTGSAMLQMKDVTNMEQAFAALVQASSLSSADAGRLTALVQQSQQSDDSDDEELFGAPKASAYESHSDGIITKLEELLETAKDDLRAARKEEVSSKNNFALEQQSLSQSIEYAQSDMDDAKKGKAEAEENAASAEGELAATEKELQSDRDSLAEHKETCAHAAATAEAQAKARAEELSALAKADQVLREMTGGASDRVYAAAASLLQTSSASSSVLQLLRKMAKEHNDAAFTQLTSQVASVLRSGSGTRTDIFAKVKGLINGLIANLEKEAAEAADEKQFCDKETKKSTGKHNDLKATVDSLSTKIDQMKASSTQLREQVKTLRSELAKLAARGAEASKIREEEHAAYITNKKTMEDGVVGVQAAIKVLQEYYGDAAAGKSSGIVGMLEVAEADFSKDLATVNSDEQSAAVEHKAQAEKDQLEEAAKVQDVKYKEREAASLEKSVSEHESDRSSNQEELDAVVEYLKKLEARCVAKAETYGETTAKRDAEIAGLHEALKILDEAGSSFVQTKQALRGIRAH